MHVVWARVLAVVAGREDVVFGTVLFGRMNAGTGSGRVPGPFINTLPVRVPTGGLGVREAVLAMRRQLAELLEHEHAPLSVAQRSSAVAAGSPLFTALFNYRHGSGDSDDGLRTDGIRLLSARERTNYPLTVAVDDAGAGKGLAVTVDAVPPLSPHEVAVLVGTATEGLVTALEETLDGGADAPLSAVEVLGEGELRQVVSDWNDTAARLPRGTLPGLFEAQVVRAPGAVALVAGGVGDAGEGVEVSYGELDARANRLARLLVGRGVGPESVVGVCLERGVDLVVALLGVLKAGAAYLPLDPDHPAERIALLLEDAAPSVVVTGPGPDGRLPKGVARVAVEDSRQLPDGPLGAPERGVLRPEHPAYVIFTSGSTGRPKGVVVPHAGIVNRLRLDAGAVRPDGGRRPGAAEDPGRLRRVGVGVLLAAADRRHAGAGPSGRPPGPGVPGSTGSRRTGCTTVHFVPSMLEAFLAEPAAAACTRAAPGDLQRRGAAAAGWRAVPRGRCRRRRCTTCTGPTEAAVDVTGRSTGARRATRPGADRPPGVRTPGSTCWTPRLRPVPAGVAGELYLAGVAAGPRLPRPARADRRAVRGRPVRRRRRGCTAPATWSGGTPTGSSSSSAAPTTRSRSAASASSSARSRPCSPAARRRPGGRRRPRRPARRQAAGRLRRARPTADHGRGRRSRRSRAAAALPELHGARRPSSCWTRCR